MRESLEVMARRGSWPTPNAADGERGSETMMRGNPTLLGAARHWPTPHGMGNDGARAAGPSGNELGNAVLKAEKMWPTPRAEDSESTGAHRGVADTLTSAVRLFPTPDAGMATRGAASNPETRRANGRTVNLGDAVAYWPTPTVDGNYNRAGASPTSGDGLATAVTRASYPTPAARDWRDDGMAPSASDRKSPCLPAVVAQKGSLNPDWVETLMGWPIGWSGPLPQESGPASEASTDGSLLVFFLEEVVSSTAGRGSKPSVTDRSRSASSLRGENSSLERPKTEEKETK